MADVELLELKFRLSDGTDIGPHKYASASTVSAVKESIITQWPKGNENAPKTIDDIKLINAGRILENKETLTESRLPIGDLPDLKACVPPELLKFVLMGFNYIDMSDNLPKPDFRKGENKLRTISLVHDRQITRRLNQCRMNI